MLFYRTRQRTDLLPFAGDLPGNGSLPCHTSAVAQLGLWHCSMYVHFWYSPVFLVHTRFLFNAKKLKGFTKPLKTIYLHTYKYDHQLKDIIALFEKPPLTTTNKTTPDIYQSSGEVSDGEDDWILSTSSGTSSVTLGACSGWDLGLVSFYQSDFILWHSEMESRYRCWSFTICNHQKPKQNARLDTASPLWAPPLDAGQSGEFFETSAKGRRWMVESPLAPSCTSCAASARRVFFVWWLAITPYHELLRGRDTSPACLPFNSGTEGVSTETSLCGLGCLNGISPHRVSAECKGLILPPSLSPHNTIN